MVGNTYGTWRNLLSHAKRISFVGVFGLNALSQTLVGGWLAHQDLMAFSVFALITGLGNLLAFLDFGAGAIVQTNFINYLTSNRSGDLLFVRFAIKQSFALSGLITMLAIILLIVSESSTLTLVAIYLIFLGLIISTNIANNLLYANKKSGLALCLSRSSWFWTLLIIVLFRNYFKDNLYQVSIVAVTCQFILGLIAATYCKVKNFLKDFDKISKVSDSEMLKYRKNYKSLALITGTAGIPLMLSLYADRYIVSYVSGTASIASLSVYGTIFSGTVGIINYLFYKERASIDFANRELNRRKSLGFLKIISGVGIIHLICGQLAIYFIYPSKVSNLQMQSLYSMAVISFGFSLRYQLLDVSFEFQKIVARSILLQASANIFLTFVLAHIIGPLAGPLATILAILLVQLPLLHSGIKRIHFTA